MVDFFSQVDWTGPNGLIAMGVLIVGASYKAIAELLRRIRASVRAELLAEQAKATVEAKNRQIESKDRELEECRAEKARLWELVGEADPS